MRAEASECRQFSLQAINAWSKASTTFGGHDINKAVESLFYALSHKCWAQSLPCPHLEVNDLVNEVAEPPKTLEMTYALHLLNIFF